MHCSYRVISLSSDYIYTYVINTKLFYLLRLVFLVNLWGGGFFVSDCSNIFCKLKTQKSMNSETFPLWLEPTKQKYRVPRDVKNRSPKTWQREGLVAIIRMYTSWKWEGLRCPEEEDFSVSMLQFIEHIIWILSKFGRKVDLGYFGKKVNSFV